MAFPIPLSRPPVAPEPPALVRSVTREDVIWNRPVFKAPPLDVRPPLEDIAALTSDLRREFSFTACAVPPLSPPQLACLRAVLDRLIPADDAPGALAAGTDHYVLHQLTGESASDLPLISAGLGQLDAAVAHHSAGQTFATLSTAHQDALLAVLDAARDPFFLRLVDLAHEGFYADPANGGEINEAVEKRCRGERRGPRGGGTVLRKGGEKGVLGGGRERREGLAVAGGGFGIELREAEGDCAATNWSVPAARAPGKSSAGIRRSRSARRAASWGGVNGMG
eukprot:gene2716-biopygen2279